MDFVAGCPVLKSALWSEKKFSEIFVNLGSVEALFYWVFEVDKVDKYGWKVDKSDVFDVACQPKCYVVNHAVNLPEPSRLSPTTRTFASVTAPACLERHINDH
ncbi:hypothetical protein ACTTAI_06735 [Rhodobacter capsulatus]|uniref:hypothetical protein n=1 Tax=Rhodobacter capsulatus TaxID=1061 RepID=UPI004026848D